MTLCKITGNDTCAKILRGHYANQANSLRSGIRKARKERQDFTTYTDTEKMADQYETKARELQERINSSGCPGCERAG